MTVEMAYHSSGQLSQLIAKNPVTGDQVTTYVYGTEKKFVPFSIFRNDLLVAEIYPDSDDFESSQNILENGLDNVADRVEFQYNRAGEVIWKRDQNGTIHCYDYDSFGRLLWDRATILAAGIDATVRKIGTAYDLAGNVKSVTSYDLSGVALDQIAYEYDECGLLCRERHAMNGEIDLAASPCITYTYDKTKDGDFFVKGLRLVSPTYPSGRVIGYEYGTANSEADQLDRHTAIKDGNVTLVTYEDEGVSTTAKVTYPQPGLMLDYTASGALDRFGRVTDHAWKKGSTDIVRIKHGYDRAGNRLYREDIVGSDFSEVYGYDGVNQLTDMQRGTLNGTKTSVTNKSFAENFAFDATGNWRSFHQDPEGNGTWPLYQTREHNKANEIVTLSGTSTYVASNKNGNMTKMPKPDNWSAAYDCVYDAWNRLVQVKDGNAVLATYVYNGLNQRIRKTIGTTVTESVFNRNWQELESKTGNAVTTYVWGLRYIDDLVCRDKGSERIYAIQDANWNVVAITDTAGAIKERIAYDTFGKPTFLDASYGSKTTSGYSWNRTFTGQVFDSETGLMLYRNRFYHAGLGRFVTRDPIGYEGDHGNLYRYTLNIPVRGVDPFGLQWNGGGMGFFDGCFGGMQNDAAQQACKEQMRRNPPQPPRLTARERQHKICQINEKYNECVGIAEGRKKACEFNGSIACFVFLIETLAKKGLQRSLADIFGEGRVKVATDIIISYGLKEGCLVMYNLSCEADYELEVLGCEKAKNKSLDEIVL